MTSGSSHEESCIADSRCANKHRNTRKGLPDWGYVNAKHSFIESLIGYWSVGRSTSFDTHMEPKISSAAVLPAPNYFALRSATGTRLLALSAGDQGVVLVYIVQKR